MIDKEKLEKLKEVQTIASRTGYSIDIQAKKPSKRFLPRVFPGFFPAISRLEAMCLKLMYKMVGTVRFERTTPTTPFSAGEKQKNKHIKRLSCFFAIAAYSAVIFSASAKLEQVIAGEVNDIFSTSGHQARCFSM